MIRRKIAKKPKKNKKTTKAKKVPAIFTGSEVGALIENFQGSVQLIAENQTETNRKVDRLSKDSNNFKISTEENFKFIAKQFVKVDGRFDRIEVRLDRLESNMSQIEERLDSIEIDIKYIKNKLDQKADKKWAKKRIVFLEKELAELKAIVAKA